ncbi:variant surface glycoprotein (VSG), putative [Trypanosoma equiperdum]|uniref:Variant surface glycoprotein (VSG), putative n=1 Tax=Trypanosoma equiperdum TaxID=5694 RepID=A0A1G4I4M1_TRYEQ|nr:variant surface glycoprotein (VSG), putative [Trypanosoma equiperdum]
MEARQLTAVAVILLIKLHLAETAGEAMKKTTWAPVCNLARELRKVPAKASSRLVTTAAASEAKSKAAYRLNLYAQQQEKAYKRIALIALSTAELDEVAAATKTQAELATDSIRATATTRELVGAIEGTMQVFESTSHSTGYCLGDGAAGQTDKISDLASEGCKAKMIDLATEAGPFNPAIIDKKGFKGLTQISGTNGMDQTDDGKCGLVTLGTAGQKAFISATTPKLSYELFKIDTSDQVTRATFQTLTGAVNRASDPLTKIAFHDSRLIEDDTRGQTTTDEQALLEETAKRSSIDQTITKLLKGIQRELDQTCLSNKVSQLKTEFYGTTGDKIKPLWGEVKQTSVQDLTATTPGKTKAIGLIPDIGELRLALAFYDLKSHNKIEKLSQEVTEANKDCKSKANAAEESCNEIGDDKPKCNNEKQCSYEDSKEAGKKCTYNASKAKEKGVPVAQTQTGGTETTTDKYKEKEQKDCKDGCKWEAETCKDSSILLNKQFSLSMAVSIVSFF